MAERTPPPRAWLAAVLSLITPGLGHAYLGRLLQGAGWFALAELGFLAVFMIGAYGVLREPSQAEVVIWLLVLMSLGLGLHVAVATLAHGAAKRSAARSRLIVPVAFFLFAWGVDEIVTAFPLGFVKAYRLPAGSMQPTLLVGDHVLVDRRPYGATLALPTFDLMLSRLPPRRPPRHGDIVVHHPPGDRETEFVKRVVAVAGETVQLTGDELRVGDRVVPEPHATYRNGGRTGPTRFGVASPFLVPEGHVFVLGDNRDASADSRDFGPVPVADVSGVAATIYWSWRSPDGWRVNWHRIGLPLSSSSESPES